jgi:hypothetical protein
MLKKTFSFDQEKAEGRRIFHPEGRAQIRAGWVESSGVSRSTFVAEKYLSRQLLFSKGCRAIAELTNLSLPYSSLSELKMSKVYEELSSAFCLLSSGKNLSNFAFNLKPGV